MGSSGGCHHRTVEQSCLNVGADVVSDRLRGCHQVASMWAVVCVSQQQGCACVGSGACTAQVRTGDAIRVRWINHKSARVQSSECDGE